MPEILLRCRTSVLAVGLAAAAVLLLPGAARAQEPEGFEEEASVYVAGYPNTPEAWEKEELVIRCLFRSHGIRWFSAGTVDATVCVPKHEEERARRLLAETLMLERLDITLLKTSVEGDQLIVVTPEEVLLQPEAGADKDN